MSQDNSSRLKELSVTLCDLSLKLASMNVSFHPPRNNKRLLIKNNPVGFNLLLKYLTLEVEYQVLKGNIDRSKEVEVHKIELETEFQRVQNEDNKEI